MVPDASVLNTQYYKVWIKGKWSNPGKKVVLSLDHGAVAIEKEDFESPSTMVGQLVYIYIYIYVCVYLK